MKRGMWALGSCCALFAVTIFALSPAAADQHKEKDAGAKASPAAKTDGQPPMKLPPGWTEQDMQACMSAGIPGKMHEHLSKSCGTWEGKTTMWMGPDTEPQPSTCTAKIAPMMDGRFVRIEVAGEMPGMGPFSGFGVNGFDNVSQKFVSMWIDNCGTGMMQGVGELSPDGKTLTWVFTANCPLTKKPTTFRQIERYTDDKAMNMEMFTTCPKTGKEYRMFKCDYTRKAQAS